MPRYLLMRTAKRYLDTLSHGRYEEAYALLSKVSRESCSLSDFKNLRDQTPWQFKDLQLILLEPDSGLIKYQLKKEGGAWTDDYLTFFRINSRWVRPYVWNLFLKIDDALKRNDLNQALALSRRAVTVNPMDAISCGYLCQSTFLMGLYNEAETACLKSLELSRSYPVGLSTESLFHIRVTMAETYKNLKKMRETVLAYSQLLSYDNIASQARCEFLLSRTDGYIALENYDAAVQDITEADPLCSDTMKNHIRQALLILSGYAQEKAASLVRDYISSTNSPTFLKYNQQPEMEKGSPNSRRNRKAKPPKDSWSTEHLNGPIYRVTLVRGKGMNNDGEVLPTQHFVFRINLWSGVITIEKIPEEAAVAGNSEP
ncbi:MAG: hypothetical protein HY399_06100 [Elusimicrobia bacterium]|nr:hypothetical protein [Elusimicrobiota bacterium]